jgi:hypothetical protein
MNSRIVTMTLQVGATHCYDGASTCIMTPLAKQGTNPVLNAKNLMVARTKSITRNHLRQGNDTRMLSE